jgi:FkbM family methyltransferase
MHSIARIFRSLPDFRGKIRLAHLLLGSRLTNYGPVEFVGRNQVRYTLPNTIDHISRELFIKGIYEKDTIDLVSGLLCKGGVFFDVGANIGAISLPVAKATGAQVHVFEPSKRTFQYLQKNKLINEVKNITLNESAVHATDGSEVVFYDVPENYGGSSLMQTYGDQPHYLVKTISIDEYCKRNNITKIDVIKIDVQGFEVEVLRGCQHLLASKAITNIIFEFEGWAETNANFGAGKAQEYLLSMGYELYTLKDRKLEKIVTTGSEMIWARLVKQH